MFELIIDLKSLVAKVKDGQYLDAGRDALKLAEKALDLIQQVKETGLTFSVAPDPEVDALLAELDKPVYGADPTNLSVVEVLALVKAVADLVRWLRNR